MKVLSVVIVFLFLITCGCMTERVQPITEYPSVPKQTTFLVKKILYDDHGRPLFSDRISSRPGRRGDRFTIVHAVNNRPVRSYDIAIVEQRKADLSKPFVVIYEWTGRGFESGLELTGNFRFYGNYSASSRDEALAGLAFLTAPIVIGSVTGFIVGVASSIPVTATELKHAVENSRETVIGYTTYEYDEKGRIKYLKTYPPAEHAEEIVRTEYFYSKGSNDPYETEVTSPAEGKTRTIR